MKFTAWMMVGILGLTLVGCKSVSKAGRSDGLIPLEVGTIWTYSGDVPGGTAADTVSASARFRSTTYFKVTGGLLGKLLREDDWIRNIGDNVMVYHEGSGVEDTLFAGGAEVGEVWSPRGDLGCMERYEDIPELETPAGTFEDLAHFGCLPGPDAGFGFAIAPHVGIVRYTWITIAGQMSLELTSYTPPSATRLPYEPGG